VTDGGTAVCARCGAEYLASVPTCAECGARLRPPGAAPVAPEGDEVAYELSDWSTEQRNALDAALGAEGVAARWEDDEVVVGEADADLVEELIEEIDAPDALAVEEDGDDEAARVLSSLYVTADVLSRDPESSVAVVELLESTEAAGSLGLPYGIDGDVWRDILRTADLVADLLGADADAAEVAVAARNLRDAVRPLV
jgi:hypothetical protein